jgi:hypothetical protein
MRCATVQHERHAARVDTEGPDHGTRGIAGAAGGRERVRVDRRNGGLALAPDETARRVDLGELGVADRWWDLAVATWSITWNFGPGYEDLFLASYGAVRDDARTRFYRLLYDLVS